VLVFPLQLLCVNVALVFLVCSMVRFADVVTSFEIDCTCVAKVLTRSTTGHEGSAPRARECATLDCAASCDVHLGGIGLCVCV
jgi:hypothetical protein